MSHGKSIWIDDASGGVSTQTNPTMRLRYSKAGVLQQAWVCQVVSRGTRLVCELPTIEWRDIPTEE